MKSDRACAPVSEQLSTLTRPAASLGLRAVLWASGGHCALAAAELGRHLKAGWRRKEAKFTLRDVYAPVGLTSTRQSACGRWLDVLVDAAWLRPHERDRNLGQPSETTSSTRAYTKSTK